MNFVKLGTSKNFILFLHGWGGSIDSFFWTKNYFKEYSLIYVDFYGFGKSSEPTKPMYVVDYATEIKKILNQYEIDSLVIVGHSFGGRVAIKFAYLYQESYKNLKLLLIDSAGIKPKRTLAYHFKIFHYKFLKKRAKTNEKARKKLSKFGSSDYKKLSSIMKQTFINIVNEDLSYEAKLINVQVVIIWGKNDKETKLYMAKKLNKFISGSKLYIFDKAGHFSYLDNKQEFLIILDSLVQNK